MTNWLCPWFMRYFLYSMDKFIKGKKITAQGVSEPPGPIGVSSSVPGSTRRSSSDWTSEGSTTTSLSGSTTVEQSHSVSDNEGGKLRLSRLKTGVGRKSTKPQEDLIDLEMSADSFMDERFRDGLDMS